MTSRAGRAPIMLFGAGLVVVALVGAACGSEPTDGVGVETGPDAVAGAAEVDFVDADPSEAQPAATQPGATQAGATQAGAATPGEAPGEQTVDVVAPERGSGGEAAAIPATQPSAVDLPDDPDGPPRAMTMAFTGDVLPHSPLWRGAAENAGGSGYDFFPMFAPIASTISSADVAICHLETPIVPVGEELSTDPLYGVPPEVVGALAQAGYDRCSTASNHALDRGTAGIDRTIEVLAENGMGQSGMARNELDSLPTLFEVNGIAVAHLSYTYGTNGIPVPEAEPWRTHLIDPVRIIRDAGSAHDLGADVVVVSLHWGTEGVTAPDDQQRSVADQITASGAIDLVIGHHAHVLQPIEQVNGVWVAYGLGNVLSNHPAASQWPASTQDAAIVEFDIDIDGAGNVAVRAPRVVPTWVDKQNGWVIRDVGADLLRTDISDDRRQVLQASFDRTSAVLGDFITTSTAG